MAWRQFNFSDALVTTKHKLIQNKNVDQNTERYKTQVVTSVLVRKTWQTGDFIYVHIFFLINIWFMRNTFQLSLTGLAFLRLSAPFNLLVATCCLWQLYIWNYPDLAEIFCCNLVLECNIVTLLPTTNLISANQYSSHANWVITIDISRQSVENILVADRAISIKPWTH